MLIHLPLAPQSRAPSAQAAPSQGERGSITVFALITLVGMISIGGLAVDTMNYEGKRVAAQDAMDRCTLMSAIAQNRIDGGSSTKTSASKVAKDCMDKSSVGDDGVNEPTVSTLNSERTVGLSGNFTFNGIFPLQTGAGNEATKSFAISSQSKQKLPKLELTVAIDYSNPANWGYFKPALKTFFNTVAAPDTGNKVSVNFVPFNASVLLGPTLIERFNDVNKPVIANTDLRTCLINGPEFTNSIAINSATALSWSWPFTFSGGQSSGTTFANDWEPGTTYGAATIDISGVLYKQRLTTALAYAETTQTSLNSTALGLCTRQTASTKNIVVAGVQVQRPITTEASPINTAIDNVVAPVTTLDSQSNSALGLKWGLALMDPSIQDVITGQVGAGTSPAPVAGRPLAYGTTDSLKVMIFVPNNAFLNSYGYSETTSPDRTSTTSHTFRELRPEYLSGTLSPIWRTPEAGTTAKPVRVSIFHADAPDPAKPYWVTQGLNTSASAPLATATGPSIEDAQWMATPFQYSGGGAPVQQTWAQVFTKMSASYVLRQLYMVPLASPSGDPKYHWPNLVEMFTTDVQTRADAMADFTAMCNEAKANGTLIYVLMGNGTVTRGTPGNATDQEKADIISYNAKATAAQTVYRNCATSPAHSFMAGTASQVKAALRVIASNIAQLTLTQ